MDENERETGSRSHDGEIVLRLRRDEVELLCEAIDSHIYWQLSDKHYRNDGFVLDPGADDPDNAAAIVAADALLAKLQPIAQDTEQAREG
jgi:hypothetical protein